MNEMRERLYICHIVVIEHGRERGYRSIGGERMDTASLMDIQDQT